MFIMKNTEPFLSVLHLKKTTPVFFSIIMFFIVSWSDWNRYHWEETRGAWLCVPFWFCLHGGERLCPPGREEHHPHQTAGSQVLPDPQRGGPAPYHDQAERGRRRRCSGAGGCGGETVFSLRGLPWHPPLRTLAASIRSLLREVWQRRDGNGQNTRLETWVLHTWTSEGRLPLTVLLHVRGKSLLIFTLKGPVCKIVHEAQLTMAVQDGN